MARKAGLEWKAVGASLDDLARTMRTIPARTPAAIAYANSGVLQQAGIVVAARYITPDTHAKNGGRQTSDYTVPANGTHGPVRRRSRDANGNLMRNSRGQIITSAVEVKLFVKGQFVSRSGEMLETAKELGRTAPTESVNVILAHGVNPKRGDRGEITAGITHSGNGYLEISGGWKAAEAGVRGGYPAGVKGWWRALRSVQGRWGTLLKKKYPDLFRVTVAR